MGLVNYVLQQPTYKSMTKNLTSRSPRAKSALKFLLQAFCRSEEAREIQGKMTYLLLLLTLLGLGTDLKWLLTEGVLVRYDRNKFEFACPLLRSAIMVEIRYNYKTQLPEVPYKKGLFGFPTTKLTFMKGKIDCEKLVVKALPFISFSALNSDFTRNKATNAPSEYAYQFELYFVIRTMLQSHEQYYSVFPEVKELGTGDKQLDILIANENRYALELGANMPMSKLMEHIERAKVYSSALNTHSTVVINFSTNKNHLNQFPKLPDGVSILNVYIDLVKK